MTVTKNILILGVGNAQVDAIRFCKNLGYRVYGISYRNEGRGRQFVDQFDIVNVVDKHAVLQHAISISADIVYSVGSDIAMPTAAYVSERLSLPFFVDEENAELLQSKGELRNFLNTRNLSTVRYTVARSLSELSSWEDYPAILKPVDSQGQRGVYQVGDFEALSRALPKSLSYSRRKEVIIEQYIDGPEVSVNAFVKDGKVLFSFISDRYVVEDLPGGIVKGHGIPSTLNTRVQDHVNTLAERIIYALEIADGPVYFQIKCSRQGVFVIEVAPRLDGCHLWRLINLKYGVNLLEETFSLLLHHDQPLDTASTLPNKPSAPLLSEQLQLDFFLQEPNTPRRTNIPKRSGTLYNEMYYEKDEIIRPINGVMEKTGYVIFPKT